MAQALPRGLLSGPPRTSLQPHAHLRRTPAHLHRACSPLALRPSLSLPRSHDPRLPAHSRAATADAQVNVPSQDDDAAISAPTPLPEPHEFQTSPLLAGWMPPRYLWRAIAAFIIAGQVPLLPFLFSLSIANLPKTCATTGRISSRASFSVLLINLLQASREYSISKISVVASFFLHNHRVSYIMWMPGALNVF
jgi:hypothetical protein